MTKRDSKKEEKIQEILTSDSTETKSIESIELNQETTNEEINKLDENKSTKKSDMISNIFKEIIEIPVEKVAPSLKKNIMPREEVDKVLEILANNFDTTKATVMIAVIVLFLKGAASEGTPQTLTVEINGRAISRRDLLYSYSLVTGNKFLRRMAEAMAEEIGQYAEKNNLKGELANRLNRDLIAKTGEVLTPQEMAWSSSFSQSIPNLLKYTSERVAKLLAEDYNKRFEKIKKQSPKKDPKGKINPKGKGLKDFSSCAKRKDFSSPVREDF